MDVCVVWYRWLVTMEVFVGSYKWLVTMDMCVVWYRWFVTMEVLQGVWGWCCVIVFCILHTSDPSVLFQMVFPVWWVPMWTATSQWSSHLTPVWTSPARGQHRYQNHDLVHSELHRRVWRLMFINAIMCLHNTWKYRYQKYYWAGFICIFLWRAVSNLVIEYESRCCCSSSLQCGINPWHHI